LEMMARLREVGVDSNTVGWYTSTYLGSFLNDSLVETQYNYQAAIKKCVVLVFDPVKTSQGLLSLRAYRLTQAFMNLYANKPQNFTKER
jgi:translation initiation factor 3 subunit H